MLTIFQVLFVAKINCSLMILNSGNQSRIMMVICNYKMSKKEKLRWEGFVEKVGRF